MPVMIVCTPPDYSIIINRIFDNKLFFLGNIYLYISGNMLRRCPKFGFYIKCIQTSYNIAGKPKPFEKKNISRFEYRFGSIILVDTH